MTKMRVCSAGIWGTDQGIVVQPTAKRTLPFDFIDDALDALILFVD